MKKLFLHLLVLLVASTLTAQETDINENDLHTYIEKVMKASGIPGFAVSVVSKNDVLFQQGFGLADKEAGKKVDSETLFYLGSCSKAFTAALVGSLVDEGKIEWQTPVVEYFPALRLYDKYTEQHVTMIELLSHQTGLPRHEFVWYNNPRNRDELVSSLQFLENSLPFRGGYQYNNLMVMLAGYIAGKVEGSTWEQLTTSRILHPLKMNLTLVDYQKFLSNKNIATGYHQTGKGIEATDFIDLQNIAPAGGIYSNLVDMNKWVQMLLNKGIAGEERLLSEKTVEMLFTPQVNMYGFPEDESRVNLGYCLGWLAYVDDGVLIYNHSGSIDGFSALVYLLPHRGIGIVLLANRDSAAAYNSLVGEKIISELMEREFDDRLGEIAMNEMQAHIQKNAISQKENADALPASFGLDSYAGTFYREGYGDIKVSPGEVSLEIQIGRSEYQLKHQNLDHFKIIDFPGGFEPALSFRTNSRGQIVGFLCQLDLFIEPLEFRKKVDERFTTIEYLKKFVGNYSIMGIQKSEITINQLGKLTLTLPNQPQFQLEPVAENRFKLKDSLVDIELSFVSESDSTIDTVIFYQPNGTFKANRIKEND